MPADFDQESKALAVEGSERNENLFRASDSSSMESGVMEEYSEKPPPPPRRRFYKQKKYWIICSIITAIIVVVVVCLIIFVFFPMIAQSLMNQAGIDVEGAQITFNPPDNLQKRDNLNMNTSFYMHMESKMSNTGPFAASLKFHNPINVYYNETLLGNITLPDGSISGGSGTLVADTPFMIQDTDYFAAFAKEMLAAEKFYWKLKGKLDITALSRTATVDLDKDVAIPGMNGFPNVTIQSFHLPSDDPNGGIKVELGTRMVSPSPVGVQLGTISLRIGYDGVNLGMVSAENIILKEGDNDILLKGTLVPQTDPAALEKVGVLFSNYVSGKMSQTTATGVSAAPDGHNPITWLSEGFQSVQLNVGLGNSQPLDIIKTVEMGYLDLAFSQEAPYSPVMSAPNVVAGFQIPFGFSLNIYEVQQNLKMATNESGEFATITTQWLPSHCDQAAGRLSFAMSNDNIIAIQGKEKEFDDYTYSLTASDLYSFQVGGSATTKTQTPIGNITLGGITFNVPTSLHGMQFLNSTPTIINSLDVTGGQTDYMELSINVTMGNPSDFSIATGDVHLNMLASGVKLGTVLLYNLTLQRGSNTVIALGTFDPKSSPVGQNLLSTFVMGQDNTVDISGFDQSTAIASLKKGLADIRIESTLPGLKSPLIQSSALTVLPDTLQTNVVNVQVSIANPFSAGLSITSVKSAITFQGMPVGNIDQDISNSPINIPGHSTVLSSPLNMQMNLEPAAVALLLRQLVVKSNMDTRPYDALLNMGGFQIAGMEQISADPSLFDNFNISSYVMQAMKALAVDLQLASGLTIGQYTNTLQFSQNNVSTSTDETVTRLIPVVGQPIVQQIVDGSKLGFDSIVLSEPTDQGFKVQMVGSISNTGPMAASISFPAPLTVAWQGRELGKVSMAAINTQPNVGAQFNVSGEFSITDQDYMGQFSAYMINNEDFVWNIYTNSVDVTAIGYTFTNISMNKFVTLGGAKGFQNCVTINSFNLPANDPQGGIQLIANTTIQNPSQIGFVLNGAGFESYFDNVLLGPLASNGMASFPPRGTSSMQMVGRLIKQNSEDGIDAITAVFTNYLNAQDSQLTVKGASGSGPNGQVGWLTTGFQSISIPNVTLPGPDKKPELIPSITMRDMELDFTKDPYAPPASSKHVEAQIKNPFGFPLGVSQVNMGVKASYDGNDVAELKVPDEPATTDNNGLMVTQFENLPFSVYDNAHAIFDAFVKALTSSSNVTFGLSGAANSVADTAVGSLKLNNITFDVQSTLAGFNNFNGQTTIIKQSVTGGTPDYIEVTLTVSFTNPSNITISIGDLTFDTIMDEHQTSVGKVMMKDVHIVPGNNTFDATMHMQNPSHKDYVDQMVSIYMTNAQAPLTIAGSADSSSIASLKDGLSTVRLATTMQGINSHLIEKAEVQARVAVIVTKKASTWVTLNNPLETAYTVKRVQVDITNENDGKPYKMGTIDYELPNPLTVPAGSQVRSDEWPVHVEADLGELLGLVGKGEIQLSLQQNVTVQVGETDGGYSSYFYYYQDHVPCSMDIQLLGISLPTTDDGDDNSSSNSTVASASSAIASAGDTVESGASKLLSGPTSTSEADKAQETASSSSSSSSSSDSSDSSSSSPSSTSSASESSDNDKPHFLWPLKV